MGTESKISATTFPKQGTYLGIKVIVCFNYDSANTIFGEVVREDVEAPGRMIIKLDDGRYVLNTECQYRPINTPIDIEK